MNPGKALIDWYNIHKRELPWRGMRDPYKIWISEIIMQQTRIAQGSAYYERFIESFPDVQSLAKAKADEVLKNWEGLGYYSRARNLQSAAKTIVQEWGGTFRPDYQEWEKLKGIGPYTARAIGSIAFGNPVAALDGNVLRITSRLLADPSPIDLPATRKKFQEILDHWIQKHPPGTFNEAMMDLGAQICQPRKPLCGKCPIQTFCKAAKEGKPEDFPVKSKKTRRTERYFHFFLNQDTEGRIEIRQRPADQGIWAGLWELPNKEVKKTEWEKLPRGYRFETQLKHVFTHFDMNIRVYSLKKPSVKSEPGESRYIPTAEIPIFAFSRAVLKIFETCL